MGRRKIYTREFKEAAVDLYNNSGRTTTDIAKELGIHPENLCRWLRENKEGKENNINVFPGHGKPRDEEMAMLRKEVIDLREENEILKKAMGYFAVKNPR